MKLRLLEKAKVSGKTVFLRADLDVPLRNQKSKIKNQKYLPTGDLPKGDSSKFKIEDDTRLVAALPTIEYLLNHNARVIMGGHLGRPKGSNHESGSKNQEFSLRPVAKWLAKRFKIYDLRFMNLDGFEGWEIGANIFLLENLRFYEGEEKNDSGFAKRLASLADVYVNDAFAVSHRSHASIVGITKFLPSFAGFHLEKEVGVLSKVLENPDRPLVVIVGGAKLETKLPLVEKMHRFADYVLVGGKIAKETESLVKVQHEKLKGVKSAVLVGELNEQGFDLTNSSVENFIQIVNLAKTIIWNGPVGFVEDTKEDSAKGSRELAQAIVRSSAYSIIGGGDTLGFLKSLNLLEKFSFLSTGGGAMLEFLSGEKLPGIETLIR